MVLSEENGVPIGSARSVDGVDIHEALEACEDLLLQFGGHTMAAGLSLELAHLEAFKERLNQAIKDQLNGTPPKPIIRCDREVHISELSLEALKELEQLEPFGPGNATPVFILRNVVSVRPPRTIGNQGRHLKITVRDPEFDGPTIDAIGWNMGEMAPQIKQNTPIDLAYLGKEHLETPWMAEPHGAQPSPACDSARLGRRLMQVHIPLGNGILMPLARNASSIRNRMLLEMSLRKRASRSRSTP